MSFYFENEDFSLKEANYDIIEKFNQLKGQKQLDYVAKKIVEDFNCNSILDCNCVKGELVLKLRELGVKAKGVSFFKEIAETVSEKALKYCEFEKLKDFFSKKEKKKVDLLISINSVKILNWSYLKQYIKNLKEISDNIIFGFLMEENEFIDLSLISSLFIQNNMVRNSEFYMVAKNFKLFYFKSYEIEDVPYVLENYEKSLQKKSLKEMELKKQNEKIKRRNFTYAKNFVNMRRIKEKNYELNKLVMDLKIQNKVLRSYEISFAEIKNSFFWRLTCPFRIVIIFLRKLWAIFRKLLFLIITLILHPKKIKLLVTIFLRYSFKGVILFIRSNGETPVIEESIRDKFNLYFKKIAPKEKDLFIQRNIKFRNKIIFSIVVPVFNPKKKYLKDMIESVKNQTYFSWQLCLADGSEGEEFSYVTEICKEYSKKDSRIVYKKIGKNLGISENTNVAIQMATGDYICFLDQDDILSPTALFENAVVIDKKKPDFLYSDEMTFQNGNIYDITFMHFKPDFSPDALRSNNYICHFSVFSSKLRKEVGFLKSEYNGSQDYDFILRLTEKAKLIYHIPKVLYYWRSSETSAAKDVSLKPYAIEAGRKAVAAHLKRIGLNAKVEVGVYPGLYHVLYEIDEKNSKVSILIPNQNHIEDLSVCVNSVLEKSTYKNFEILILENGSNEETLDFYEVLKKKDKRIKIVKYNKEFNYSDLNNFGASIATGQYLLFLNNDTEIITPDWIQEMLMFAQREDVGAVGAKLYFHDDTIQHAGVFINIIGLAGHSCKHLPRNNLGYATRAGIVQNLSAVTAACLMVKKFCFFSVGGFDEALKISFNDVDFCLKLREKGYLNVFTPYAELYHYESKSRGKYPINTRKYLEMVVEGEYCKKKHPKIFSKKDPYYNPNLTEKREDLSVRLDG